MKFINLLSFCVDVVTMMNVQNGCSTNSSYDTYLLAVEYHPHYYKNSMHLWTIHGLWPSKSLEPESYPCYCTDEKFNVEFVSDIVEDLDVCWPSTTSTNEEFWSHEYEKHGTCTGFGQKLYFKKTLKLFDSLVLNLELSPGSYNSSGLLTRFRYLLGKTPMLGCKNYNNEQHLSEIGVCYSTNFTIEDCPNPMHKIHDEVNSCSDKNITL